MQKGIGVRRMAKGEKRERAEQGEKSLLKLTWEDAGTQQEEEVSLGHEKSHCGAELGL